MNEAEAKKFLSGDFGKEMLTDTLNYTTTISWGVRENNEWTLLSNGSAFFLDCGQGPFGVTAAHVYEGYLEEKKAKPDIRCQIGNFAFDFEERIICHLGSKAIDIVTFRTTQDEIGKLKKRATLFRNWPPERITVGQGAILTGFPGAEREKIDARDFSFGLYTGLTPVSSVSDRHWGCALENENWIDTFGRGIPPVGYDMGGMSGGPAFHLKESDAGIYSWEVCGVIYQAHASELMGEIVLAHHLEYINPDGTLEPTR